MAVTGKLGKIASFVQKSSHNADQRRLERKSNKMFDADERTMLDREFDEAASRGRMTSVPDRRTAAPAGRSARTVEPVSVSPRTSRGTAGGVFGGNQAPRHP